MIPRISSSTPSSLSSLLTRRFVVATVVRRDGSSDAAASASASTSSPGLPSSVKRVGKVDFFPNEGPGRNILFNWQLNKDGVTPTKESAFRITKPLDLKIAGLPQPRTNPLKIAPAPATAVPEAGSDELSFDDFDAAARSVKDALSRAPHLYCPEGHAPGTRTGVRLITNSKTLASDATGWLDRAPVRAAGPVDREIIAYAYEIDEDARKNSNEEVPVFSGHAIEEIEPVEFDVVLEPKSVAAVVVSGSAPLDAALVVAGVEASVAGLAADEKEREEAKAEEERQRRESEKE